MGAIMWRNAIRFFIRMALAAAVLAGMAHTATRARATEVDLLLALAADVSRSVDQQKFSLQRNGYAAAITNPRVIQAVRSGRLGRIAVCYIEWSGSISQNLLIDWTVIGAKTFTNANRARLKSGVGRDALRRRGELVE